MNCWRNPIDRARSNAERIDLSSDGRSEIEQSGKQALSGNLGALTSLRFFAAFSVLLYHVPYVLPAASTQQLFPAGGSLGVSFFFVLSGFILAYAHRAEQPLGVGRFYAKRFARIYPMHLLTFVVLTVVFFHGWGNSITDRVNSGVANVTLLQAWFIGDVYHLGYNAVSWSLSVEAFFYAMFPLLRRPKVAAAWIGGHSIVLGMLPLHGVAVDPSFAYFNPLARTLEFCMGILTFAIVSQNNRRFFMGDTATALALALAATTSLTYTQLPVGLQFAWTGLGFAAVIAVFSVPGGGMLPRILSVRPLTLLGEASFALYMIHHMLFRILQDAMGGGLHGWPLLATATAIVLVCSIILHLAFEQPARDYILVLNRRRPTRNEAESV